jgi:hypothetical protein
LCCPFVVPGLQRQELAEEKEKVDGNTTTLSIDTKGEEEKGKSKSRSSRKKRTKGA